MQEAILIDAGNIIAWLNVQIEKARRGDLPIDFIAYYGEAMKFVKNLPTIEADIDRAAILRMCNEIEMIIVTVCDTGYTLQEGDVEAIIKRTKGIRKEVSEDAGAD